MMHDALRADVLASLLAQTPDEWKEVNDSVREHAEHFREMIEANDATVTDPELRSALREVSPVLDNYIRSAETVIAAAQRDPASARTMLPKFTADFEELEGRLSDISDRIQESAAAAETHAQASTAAARMRELIILLAALIVTIVAATWIVRSISGGISSLVGTITEIQHTRDLSKRVNVTSHDELGRLAECFKLVDRRAAGHYCRGQSGRRRNRRWRGTDEFFEPCHGERSCRTSA